MLVIPAVDIKDGKAVRLKKGLANEKTVYDNDPVNAARRWADGGAKRIHIVDLDGAFDGAPKNAAITLNILKAFAGTHEIQIGGGLRTEDAIARFIDAGAARCVVGTKALEDRAFLEKLANRFPGKVSVGIDAKDGMVATKGWVDVSTTLATDMVAQLKGIPLGEIIYTDIDRDGMLEGPNLKRLEEMSVASPFPLIASGGVTTLENVRECAAMKCYGAIVGKAFYDGRMELKDALDIVK
ncbi:MAG: 1-(5-phosphoribosyl)-5-[(5-phosphoribosylamino)methylideneamino]imidazole-4-carboxamide isomerase [Planctomycetota bacterium]